MLPKVKPEPMTLTRMPPDSGPKDGVSRSMRTIASYTKVRFDEAELVSPIVVI
jgi:hypothetical protein